MFLKLISERVQMTVILTGQFNELFVVLLVFLLSVEEQYNYLTAFWDSEHLKTVVSSYCILHKRLHIQTTLYTMIRTNRTVVRPGLFS